MNDFNGLLARVAAQARALDLPISPHIDPEVAINRRAARFGCCRRRGEGYQIELSDRLLEAGERACCQTLAHELLHTCPGCQNHGPRWRGYAQQMNAAYGYHIARTDTCAALGIPDLAPARYVVVCNRCGMEYRRVRASRLVQHPEHYRCRCGGTLTRQDGQEGRDRS